MLMRVRNSDSRGEASAGEYALSATSKPVSKGLWARSGTLRINYTVLCAAPRYAYNGCGSTAQFTVRTVGTKEIYIHVVPTVAPVPRLPGHVMTLVLSLVNNVMAPSILRGSTG